jgi:hypothetical protein
LANDLEKQRRPDFVSAMDRNGYGSTVRMISAFVTSLGAG